MEFSIHSRIADFTSDEWNAVTGEHDPFLRFEFLHALETCDAASPQYGWYPRHLVARDHGKLIGAMPMYLKTNSYGEFVFDWAWADAYERLGLEYYPKLVSSIPYTPATGNRICIHPSLEDKATLKQKLLQTAVQYAKDQHLSSIHCLFTNEEDTQALRNENFLLRMGAQYHWFNDDYSSFSDFLETLSSKKRKNIRRERRRVNEQNIAVVTRHGNELDENDWKLVEYFYRSTFERKSGYATLHLDFWQMIGSSMGDQIVLNFAYDNERPVACAIMYKSKDTLYGRHWGCLKEYDSLHFELCYYQGIEYAITHKLKKFEPGAQGEYKISRGFIPVRTWSAHWLANEKFRPMIENYLEHETAGMEEYIQELNEHTPFKQHEDQKTPKTF